MKTKINLSIGEVIITSKYLNNKSALWSDENNHNHLITIQYKGKKTTFEFWNSLSEGEIKTESSLLETLSAFIDDSMAGDMEYHDFCDEFGYDEEYGGVNKKPMKIYNSCVKMYKKYERLFSADIYDLSNEVHDIING